MSTFTGGGLWHLVHVGTVALAMLCAPAQAQTLKDETRLVDKPGGAPLGATLASGTAVKVLGRQGFWVEVDVKGSPGWLKASSISFSSNTGGATAIDTGRLGKGNIVATSAARGLSAKDLLNGSTKPEEVDKMATFAPDPASQNAFAMQGSIRAVEHKLALKAVEPPPRASVSAGGVVTGSANGAPSKLAAGKKDGDEW